MRKLNDFLEAVERVRQLKAFRAAWTSAGKRVANVRVEATFLIDGREYEGEGTRLVSQALADRARKGIGGQIDAAIVDAEAARDALKAAAKAEYDPLFI